MNKETRIFVGAADGELNSHIHKSQDDHPAVYVGTYAKYNDGSLDGDFVDLKYYFQPRFQHVYRATDYLVKTLDVLNDAKRAEYRDKVTHPVN